MDTINRFSGPENTVTHWTRNLIIVGVLGLSCVPGSAEAEFGESQDGMSHVNEGAKQVDTLNEASSNEGKIGEANESAIDSEYPNAILAEDEYLDHCDANMREFRGKMKGLELNGDYCFIKGAKKGENCSNVDGGRTYQPENLGEVYIKNSRGMIGGCFYFKGNNSHSPHWAFQILGPEDHYSDPNKEYDVIFNDSLCRDATFCENKNGAPAK